MIIPVGINHVIKGWPVVTLALIITCTLVQIYEDAFAPSVEDVQRHIAQKIAELPPDADDATQQRIADEVEDYANKIPSFRFGYRTGSGLSYRLVTCAFVHVGWLHLLGNMIFLWLAGAALEDKWGKAKFAGFYVVGAVVSALGFAVTNIGNETLLVGASGAIAALMGAFLVYFARMQIHFVYWLGRGIGRFDAVAYIVLPIWLGEQFLYNWLEGDKGGVAFSAHICGFFFGVVAALIAKLVSARMADAEEEEPKPIAAAASAPAPVVVAPPPRIEAPKQEAPADPGTGPKFLT